MLHTLIDVLKKERLAWAWALIIGLFLIVLGHAPILPIIAGCLLAVGISVLRRWPQRIGKSSVRGA